jgi:2-methylaconitate cis-trans-isomerase PrpF
MACRIPGTIAARYLRANKGNAIRLGHPCGTITVKAAARQDGSATTITEATIQRTAHLIARGELFVKERHRHA